MVGRVPYILGRNPKEVEIYHSPLKPQRQTNKTNAPGWPATSTCFPPRSCCAASSRRGSDQRPWKDGGSPGVLWRRTEAPLNCFSRPCILMWLGSGGYVCLCGKKGLSRGKRRSILKLKHPALADGRMNAHPTYHLPRTVGRTPGPRTGP